MKRGDVVLVDWPYSDRSGSKLRPAVVVQADFLTQRIDDTVLVLITRTTRRAAATEAILDPAVETKAGLGHNSVASCNNFLTIDQALVYRTIGVLSGAAMRTIDDRVKVALALP